MIEEPIVHHTMSRDGTEIGYWTTGDGPPLLLVHGGLGDHRRWDALRPHLEPHISVHAMDRRGRGASGDHPDWSIEREYEDVAAVVDAVAEESRSAVDVYGVSLGGMCALGSTAHTSNVRKLALYEGWPYVPEEATAPPDFIARMEERLAEGDPEGALEAAYRELLDLSDEEVEHLRAQPEWSARVAAAHTIPRELRTADEVEFDRELLAEIDVPTLLLTGERSPDWKADEVADALPDARIEVLEGQAHTADLFAPDVVAEPLLDFLAR